MKWLIGLAAVITVGLGVGAWQALPLARVGSAYTAKAVCSGVFVSQMEPERVFSEEVEHLSPAISYVNYQIDRESGEVKASLMGLGGRTAVYRDGTGCTLEIGGAPAPLGDVPERHPFKPLPKGGLPSEQARAVEAAIDDAFTKPINGGAPGTRAIVVTLGGDVVAERYADGVRSGTPLKGWSMNKTLTGIVIGQLVDRGWLALDAPAPVAEWSGADDPRGAITLRHLMTMTSGLDFDESYGDMQSDVVEMLFNERSAAARAAASPLAHEPGTHWSYSSGTTNILARIAHEALGAHNRSFHEFIASELFLPLGIETAYVEADAAGDFIGSSFGYMAPHDWARIGRLLIDAGRAPDGRQLVSSDWIAFMSTDNGLSQGSYGAQLWVHRQDPQGEMPPNAGVPADTVFLSGHDGQMVAAIPSKGLVIVRLGETPTWTQGAGAGDLLRAAVTAVDALPPAASDDVEAVPTGFAAGR
ncbi:serine hydrolase [bacterium]|nr:serine hydrolase [bacterium]